jgi:hypothetical protein
MLFYYDPEFSCFCLIVQVANVHLGRRCTHVPSGSVGQKWTKPGKISQISLGQSVKTSFPFQRNSYIVNMKSTNEKQEM